MIRTSKEVKWIQLSLDVFNNKKIRALEKMPEGDTLIIIWFKILVLAGQINDNGCVYFTREIPYTDQLLSDQFDRPLSTVQLALGVFQKFGMINIVDDIICVSNWAKYQNERWLDEARRERDRERKKRLYNRQEELLPQESEEILHGNSEEIPRRIQGESEDSLYLYSNNISTSLSNQKEEKNKGCGEKEKKPRKGRETFVKPTVEEVDAYCSERKNGIKGASFVNYYESVGWVVGASKKPMKNWKSAVIQWEIREQEKREKGETSKQPKSHYNADGSYDYQSGLSDKWESL